MGNIWRFVCFYVPAWCYIFFILLMYTLLVGRIIFVFRGMDVRRKGKGSKIKFNLKISQLLVYPLLLCCSCCLCLCLCGVTLWLVQGKEEEGEKVSKA